MPPTGIAISPRKRRSSRAVRTEVTDKLEPPDRAAAEPLFRGSPIYPGHFAQDFNRSYVLEPNGAPVGAVVLLHGLTDAPYSQRHIAAGLSRSRLCRDRDPDAGARHRAGRVDRYRMGGLDGGDAACRCAKRVGASRRSAPLHLVGFSNGGALALKYALDAIADPQLARPDRLVLDLADDRHHALCALRRAREPAGGAAGFRQGGLARHRARIQSVQIQLIPGQRRGSVVSADAGAAAANRALQPQRPARGLPPIITFQSVMDFTVSTSAIISALYERLPANGSELVLFDVNRTVKFGLLLRPSADTELAQLLPPAAQLPDDHHHQCRRAERRRSRARNRGRRHGRARPRARAYAIRRASTRCRTSRCRFR